MDSHFINNGLEMKNYLRDLYIDQASHTALCDCIIEILSDFKSLGFLIRILNCEVVKDIN